jgi:hypothetical protein
VYFVSIYENKKMKPVEIVLRRRIMEGINLRYIVSTYIVNITIYPPAQLLYANKIFFKKNTVLHTQHVPLLRALFTPVLC